MATGLQDYGYEDNRFENAVSENFHCSICLNVFKEPKMCRNNQHVFCFSCITRHLANSPRCPECNEELTVETLSQAPRVILNCLSELKIKCDYFSRDCREFVQLGNLPSHVRDCGFAPVACSNQGCGVEINKRDRIYHETEVCHFRKVQCHDCRAMRLKMEELRRNVAELKVSHSEVKRNLVDHRTNQTQLKLNVAEVKKSQEELKKNHEELKKNQEELKINQEELKVNIKELKDQLNSFKDDIAKQVRVAIEKVLKSTDEVVPAVPPSLRDDAARKQDIVIAGGFTDSNCRTNSVEEFNWSNRTWAHLPPMKKVRSSPSSFAYGNQVFVAGGFNGNAPTAEIEAIKITQEPLEWIMFPGKLPARLHSQGTVVYRNRLIVVGGESWDKHQVPYGIYEVFLVQPYSTKLLYLMQQRRNHGTEIINDKIYILGGRKSVSSKDALDSVIVYDIVTNKCENFPPLPYAVCSMSTVSWQNKVIVLGGEDKNGEILDNVIMYDIVKGECDRLPSMMYKRVGCAAVITANCIVVMGGWNRNQKHLNAVECYNFSANSWQELPPMNENRNWASAVVKPC